MFSGAIVIAVIVVILALAFDFINGFHDTANAIATSVSTRVLTPRQAIIMAAVLNFAGAMISVKVAKTVGADMVDPKLIPQTVIVAALSAAIIWNLITWYYGIPSSSSHALIGGLIGSAIAFKGTFAIVNWTNFFNKIVLWLIISPIIGFIIGYIFMIIINWILRPFRPRTVSQVFAKLQICSAAAMAFSHGSNDAQKAMGIITMALLSGGLIDTFAVPGWVKISCALAMGLGTSVGGWKIIKTMGVNMARLAPVNGFAAEASAAAIIMSATFFHAPVSTTHIISTSIMGVGASKRLSNVRWSVANNIVWAWVLTIPVCAILAGIIVTVIHLFV